MALQTISRDSLAAAKTAIDQGKTHDATRLAALAIAHEIANVGSKYDTAYQIPTAVVMPYAGTTEPDGWLFCDGDAVSRTTYATLFGVIGETFGAGDLSTTFNLPDLRGRVPAGKDNMGGSSANRITDSAADSLGGAMGSEDHTLTTDEMPAHTHDQTVKASGSGAEDHFTNDGTSSGTTTLDTTGSTGGGSAHNNVQPTNFFNFIIKT